MRHHAGTSRKLRSRPFIPEAQGDFRAFFFELLLRLFKEGGPPLVRHLMVHAPLDLMAFSGTPQGVIACTQSLGEFFRQRITMDLLVQHTNLATRNDALEFHRDALAEELIQTLSARNNTLWSATERHQIEWSEGPQMTDKDWTAFLEESQEEFKEECAEVSLRLWNEWSAAQLP